MAVVAVDLASRRWEDVGLAAASVGRHGRISLDLIDLGGEGRELRPRPLAEEVDRVARSAGAGMVLVDGPQGWCEPGAQPGDRRACEAALGTPAKTGEPGRVKPRSYTSFSEFSISVFDALESRGWKRWAGAPRGRAHCHAWLCEVYPRACWKRLGLTPLPSKSRATAADLDRARHQLRGRLGFPVPKAASHDQLQAVVACWAGLAWSEGWDERWEAVGRSPVRVEGHPREGVILLPRQGT
jgi:hypothetical protein